MSLYRCRHMGFKLASKYVDFSRALEFTSKELDYVIGKPSGKSDYVLHNWVMGSIWISIQLRFHISNTFWLSHQGNFVKYITLWFCSRKEIQMRFQMPVCPKVYWLVHFLLDLLYTNTKAEGTYTLYSISIFYYVQESM